ncbi:MAG: hypothetical protein SVS15_04135 [Thermodesulfobacteriota bacterium]|nr:hypothetical protein [Thermodesulfobacteriota bacterium]
MDAAAILELAALVVLIVISLLKWSFDSGSRKASQKALHETCNEIKENIKDGFKSVWETVDLHGREISRIQGRMNGKKTEK